MKRTLAALVIALGLLCQTNDAASTCANSVTATAYGNTCVFFTQDSKLSAVYDATACNLRIELTASQTCCNTFLAQQFLMIGATPIIPGIALPELVPGCELALVPLVILAQSPTAGGVWNLYVPPVPSLVTLYAQGANDYFTTIGMSHDYQTSNGLKLDIL